MENNNTGRRSVEDHIIPVLVAAIILLILIALISGDGDHPPQGAEAAIMQNSNGQIANKDWLSIEVTQLNKKTARKYNVPAGTRGVMVEEIKGARDVTMKLCEGDVICAINGKRIKSVRDFRVTSRSFDPIAGVFMDITRNGNQMYVTLAGDSYMPDQRTQSRQIPQTFGLTKPAPFMNQNIDPGGVPLQGGVLGTGIENWVNHNFGGNHFSCSTCGTLIPQKKSQNNQTVYCPNCHNKMVLR